MIKTTTTPAKWLIYLLAIINVAIHILVYNNLEYHRDELLYFSQGLHPDFGYATVPPLISWMATTMQLFFGFSLFSVKIFPAVLSGFLVLLTANIAKEFGGKSYAQLLSALAIIVLPVAMRAFHLFQPVPLDMFFWTLITWLVLRYANTRHDKYLIAIGVVFGIAMLNKYLVALWLLALLLGISFSEYRIVFTKKSFYIALAVGILVFLPNLLWQINKGFPVIDHMHNLNQQQLVYVNRGDFLKDQLLMPFATTLLAIPGLFHILKNNRYRFLAIAVIITVITLFILRGKSYYTMGIFPLLIASGAIVYENLLKNKFLRIVLPVFMILITLPLLPLGIPIYKQQGLVAFFKRLEDNYGLTIGRSFEDGVMHSLPQDYADELGWEELTQITAKAWEKIPDKSKAVIYAENYGQAGAIAVIGKKYGLPEPLSFHESFIYWVPRELYPEIEYFIYINNELGEDIQNAFCNIQEIGHISNPHAREYGTTVYLCTQPKTDLNKLWKMALEREQRRH